MYTGSIETDGPNTETLPKLTFLLYKIVFDTYGR